MPRQPNILFVMADQFRFDALGVVNGWTRTGALDGLARQGSLFTNAITNSAECIPARFSLATGLYPHQTGVQTNGLFTLNPAFPNWMQAVRHAGYRTSLFGKTHLHPHVGDLRDRVHLVHAYGFDVVDETAGPRASAHVLSNMTQYWQDNGVWDAYRQDLADRFSTKPFIARPSTLGLQHYYDVYVARQACRYLESYAHPEPWHCWVSFGGPHEPWDAPEPYAGLYREAEIPVATSRMKGADRVNGLLQQAFDSPAASPHMEPGDVRAMRANYAGNVTLIDDQVAKILDVISQRGELDNTLIIFTSDHGEMNGDQGLIYKGSFLDPVIKVPLIIRAPERQEGGQKITAIVELMDLGATIVDYALGSLPAFSKARSLRGLLEGQVQRVREFVVTEFRDHVALINDDWKVEFAPDGQATLLFDRHSDPCEQVNLVNDSRFARDVSALQDKLRTFCSVTPVPSVKVADA